MEKEQVQAAIQPVLDQIKKESFVADYEATNEEAMGMLLSKYFEWAGDSILEAAGYGLEDANFHSEAKIVRDLLPEGEETVLR